jgi:hypothetical protein
VRLGILCDEFKTRFVNGKSDETLARTLYDVLLARTVDAGGLDYWEKEVGLFGWENVVDRILASPEYNNSFGDDAVPGGGRAPCVSSSTPVPAPEVRTAEFIAFVAMANSVIPEMSMDAKVRTAYKLDRLLLV